MSVAKEKRSRIRVAIRDGALREFARNGLAGTSTRAIADAAGITKAQLHYYISSKEDLYQEVLSFIFSEWRALFFISSAQDDPETAIRAYITRKLRHAVEHPEFSRLFVNEMARGAPEMNEHWPKLKAATEEASAVIRKWIDEGKIAPVDPLLFQINMWAVTQHYAEYEQQSRILFNVGPDQPLDMSRINDEVTQLFLMRCGLLKAELVR